MPFTISFIPFVLSSTVISAILACFVTLTVGSRAVGLDSPPYTRTVAVAFAGVVVAVVVDDGDEWTVGTAAVADVAIAIAIDNVFVVDCERL